MRKKERKEKKILVKKRSPIELNTDLEAMLQNYIKLYGLTLNI